MPSDSYQSDFIYGLHDPGGEWVMEQAGAKGWILFTEAIGADPNDRGGRDYSDYGNRGFGVMVRLNNGYEPAGTIPRSDRYNDFARRCANFVQNSRGCTIWIIGNEMNHPVERAGGAGGEVITPELYARCYRQCREAMHLVQPQAQVLVGGAAPWNPSTTYPGNPNGDWVLYFADILKLIGPTNCDGFTLHAYTHGDDPNLIASDATMNAPFQNRRYNFRTYQDFLNAVPASMRSLPCYITETDQGDIAWTNRNTTWVQRAYGEIDWWNRQPGNQVIRALILYRWPQVAGDRWGIDGKQGVIEDFRETFKWRYTWPDKLQQRPEIQARFVEHTVPAALTAGSVSSVKLRVRNEGSKTWPKAGANPVRLGYHWLNASGAEVSFTNGDLRTELPNDVPANGEVTFAAAKLAVPTQAAKYTLRWDLVEEGVAWFRSRGSQPLTVAVEVKAGQSDQAPPVEQFFPETKKTVRGPFLDWFRRFGLDVAGYPITEEYRDTQSGLQTQYFQRVALELQQNTVRLRLAGVQALEAQQQIGQLQARIKQLEDQIKRGNGVGVRIPQPTIQDIANSLPRDASALIQRPQSDIQYLVVNHTAVRPEIGADRVAEAQRKRWPAIVHQYFITVDGAIQQTNPLTEVVSRAESYIYNAVNIAIAGNFTDVAPNEAQLNAAAALMAWLLQELKLPVEAIKGVSEFIVTGSPGRQWLSGQNYKQTLLTRIQAIKPEGDGASPIPSAELEALRNQVKELNLQLATRQAQLDGLNRQVTDLSGQIKARQDQVDALTRQVAELAGQIKARQDQVDALTRQVQEKDGLVDELNGQIISLQMETDDLRAQLEAALAAGGGPHGPGLLPAPIIRDVIAQLPRKEGFKSRDLAQVKLVVINHTAVDPSVTAERIAQAHMGRWPGITYHYYIQADGAILQTGRLTESVDDLQAWLFTGVQVCFAGNFKVVTPTDAQLDAGARLCAWLLQQFKLPIEALKGVSEFVATASPGAQWLQGAVYKNTLVAKVKAVQASAPPDDGGADTAALRGQIERLKQDLAATQTSLNTAQTTLNTTQATLDTTQAQLTAAQQNATRLQTALTQSQAQAQTLQGQVTTLQGQVGPLQQDKTALQKQVGGLQQDKTTLQQQAGVLQQDKTTLQKQVGTLQQDKTTLQKQVGGLQQDKTTLQQQVGALQKQIQDLLAGGGGTPKPVGVEKPQFEVLADKLPLSTTPGNVYGKRQKSAITHIVVHHTAAPAEVGPDRLAAYHVNSRSWPGIGYHFFVGADGTLYQTNHLETVSYQTGGQNNHSMGIVFAGNFTDVPPTPIQIERGAHLIAWLAQDLKVPNSQIMGHKEMPEQQTACPGNQWTGGQQWKKLLFQRIQSLQSGESEAPAKFIRHYLLLWWRSPTMWAEPDYQGAAKYIARFEPTVGFSPDEAKLADYVTIIGGPGGTPGDVDDKLRAAGVKVERIAGADFTDTKRQLDSLAESGRRFRSFNVGDVGDVG
ncbi:MAG: N-acetylmuramoyl-L-alanine amidase [Anaerolineae bacterium]